jgi:hypothetical protein
MVGLRVRSREPLRKKLEVAAKQHGVSLNAELVRRLDESFLHDSLGGLEARIEEMDQRVRAFRIEMSKAAAEKKKLRRDK